MASASWEWNFEPGLGIEASFDVCFASFAPFFFGPLHTPKQQELPCECLMNNPNALQTASNLFFWCSPCWYKACCIYPQMIYNLKRWTSGSRLHPQQTPLIMAGGLSAHLETETAATNKKNTLQRWYSCHMQCSGQTQKTLRFLHTSIQLQD